MYSSSYSRAKFGLEGREPLHRHKGKSCGYYMRIVFFFSSLIQSLIIVSLVLFVIYGQPEKTAEEKRVKDLELNNKKLGDDNVQLRKEKAELGSQLGARSSEKSALEKEMEKLKTDANNTEYELKGKITNLERQVATTRSMVIRCSTTPMQPSVTVPFNNEIKNLQNLNAHQKAMISLIEANFTHMVQSVSQERDNAVKDRDEYLQETITLRRDKTMLEEQLKIYTRKCKEDFSHSLDGIQTVTRDFLNKINNLFPHQLTFHLTCERQQEQVEKIKTSCTNLSRDVENKFQMYLDNVGNKVSEIQGLSSGLEVRNSHLTADLKKCELSRSEAVTNAGLELQQKQITHDKQMETLLMEKNQLRQQKQVQEQGLAMKEAELRTLMERISAQPNCKHLLFKTPSMTPQLNRPLLDHVSSKKTPTVR